MPKILEGETEEMKIRVPKTLVGYLTVLAKESMMGASGGDIAAYLLTKEVQRLFDEGAHAKRVPQPLVATGQD